MSQVTRLCPLYRRVVHHVTSDTNGGEASTGTRTQAKLTTRNPAMVEVIIERGRCQGRNPNVSRAPSQADVKNLAGLVAGFPCAGHRSSNPTVCVSTYTDPSPPAICHATLFAVQKLQPRTVWWRCWFGEAAVPGGQKAKLAPAKEIMLLRLIYQASKCTPPVIP